MVSFKQQASLDKKEPKFGPRGVDGIFLGYHVLPGGQWKGDYWVATLEEFAELDFGAETANKKIRMQRVGGVIRDQQKAVDFPLRAKAAAARALLLGVPAALADAGAYDCIEAPEVAAIEDDQPGVQPLPSIQDGPLVSYDTIEGGIKGAMWDAALYGIEAMPTGAGIGAGDDPGAGSAGTGTDDDGMCFGRSCRGCCAIRQG